MNGAIRVDERMAQIVAERVHGLTELTWQPAQSDGEVDFLDSARSIALEVTSARDPRSCEVEEAIRFDPRGGFVERTLCRHDWNVVPTRHAKIRRIRKRVDAMLADVESAGISEFQSWRDAALPPSALRIMNELGLECGHVCEWNPSGRIGIGLPTWDGEVRVEDAVRAIEAAVGETGNCRKLARTGARRRELAIAIHHSLPLVETVFSYCRPPEGPVVLPDAITHVTVFASVGTQRLCVWHAASGTPWSVSVVALTSDDVTALCGCLDSGTTKLARLDPTGLGAISA